MLEGLATWFLNNYLGKYLQLLDTTQLSISLLAGQVELENVPLRKDALRFIEPSVAVRSGQVGHIKLTVPVSRMRSEPWTLLLEDVCIVLGPQRFSEFDEEAEEGIRLETKLAALDCIEAEWRAAQESRAGSSYKPVTSGWLDYGASFIGTIVENLQLTVRRVHIRYEDDVTVPGTTFAAGITLESLAAQTCDDTWQPRFVSRNPALGQLDAFKLVELEGMAAYLDTSCRGLGDTPSQHLGTALAPGTGTQDREYLLEPVSASASLKRHCLGRPLNSKRQPRMRADISLEELSLKLSDLQFQRGIAGARSLHMLRRSRQFWRWRPGEKVCGAARRWWRYAITCTVDLVHSRRSSQTWEAVLAAARDNVAYVEAFKAQLSNSNTVTDEQKVLKEAQDNFRTYDELRALREISVFWLDKEREERSAKGDEEEEEETSEEAAAPTLQRWFPLWGGWYDGEEQQTQLGDEGAAAFGGGEVEVQEEEATIRPPKIEKYLQDAIKEDLDVYGVSHKDVVFSHLTVHLKEASVRLLRAKVGGESSSQGQLLFHAQFNDVKAAHELRPRTGSLMFSLTVGAVFLRDKITRNSLFPLLISPQSSMEAPLCPRAAPTRLSEMARSFQSYLPTSMGPAKEEEPPLLNFLYELKPFNSKADHKVHVRSQPLDIVFNPNVIKVVSEFFKVPSDSNSSSHLSDTIRSAALNRLQRAKERTKEEFTKNINQMLQGSSLDRKIWDVMLDLSAPKLLVPDHFEDKDAPLIVVDFGKMLLSNNSAFNESKGTLASENAEEEEEDDDLFVTPASSPGLGSSTPKEHLPQKDSAGPGGDSELLLHNKLYDRFAVDFNNMQIIVGQVKDNWKGAHLKGNSALHVVDRFSISLVVERRTFETVDPAWPSLVVAANLPRLQLHVNESKVRTLHHMVTRMLGPDYGGKTEAATQTVAVDRDFDSPGDETLALWSDWEPDSGAEVSARLLVAHFVVSDLSLELQSQGRPVVELQVTNMRAGLTRRPYDTNLSLSVHSLLLVDALQTLGPDYELLVASHKHVSVDSVSGSLFSSDPASPASPGSPQPGPAPNHQELHSALSSLRSPPYSPPAALDLTPPSTFNLPAAEMADPNALISIEIMLVSPKCPTLEEEDELRIVNVQFNSLDVIANQETFIELLGFCRRVTPHGSGLASQYSQPSLLSTEVSCQTDATEEDWIPQFDLGGEVRRDGLARKTELTAEFQRLNVLLLRAESGRRIGTALLTDARLRASLATGDTATCSGSLGGLQVRNLLSPSLVHQRIISVGREPLALGEGATSADVGEAFTFSFEQKDGLLGEEERLAVSLHISSVVYTHSSTFMEELNNCATDFKRYMAGLAQSITTAATDLALGIVSGAYRESTPNRSYSSGVEDQFRTLPRLKNAEKKRRIAFQQEEATKMNQTKMRLELVAVLETPVLVFPRLETSLEVLVAHLGQITVRNSLIDHYDCEDLCSVGPGTAERFTIQVVKVNLTSLNLETKLKGQNAMPSINQMTAQNLFDSSKHGIPILHDTNLEVTLDKLGKDTEEALTQIKGRVVNPLKVSLSRPQYQQVLDTLKSPAKSKTEDKSQKAATLEGEEEKQYVEVGEQVGHSRLEGSFELPLLSLELRRDAFNAAIEPGIVSLTCTDFGLVYDKDKRGLANVQMALRGLVMEDLLLAEDSPQRNLMVSSKFDEHGDLRPSANESVSTSCPDLRARLGQEGGLSKSLPDNLDTHTVFGADSGLQEKQEFGNRKREKEGAQHSNIKTSSLCNSPLPSAMLRKDLAREGNLVTINTLAVPLQAPDLVTKYGGTNKFVNVDFNSLDINFNLQTWVVILDFFGIGSGGDQDEVVAAAASVSEVEEAAEEHGATEVDIKVRSLSVNFNRSEKSLFKSTVLNYSSKIQLKDGNFCIEGQLGNFCIKDLTNHGILYRDRFLCRGEQILGFKIFKFGKPDPELSRENDISVDLRMAAITYVHTQRFYNLMMDFFKQFQELQGTMASHRATSTRTPRSAVGFAPPAPGRGRGSRIKLNVEASQPLLVLPLSSYSTLTLMLDLGCLEIHNKFNLAGDEGTISASKLSNLRSGELGGRRSRAHSSSRSSHRSRSSARSGDRRSRRSTGRSAHGISSDEEFLSPLRPMPTHRCLLDVMHINLRALDLVVAERLSAFTSEEERKPEDVEVGGCLLRRQQKPLLKEKCELKLQVERNLDGGFSHNVPDISVKGLLSSVHAVIDVEQYKLIRGLLAHNLGEQMEPLGEEEADLLGKTVEEEEQGGELWTTTFMDIELHGVTVDLVEVHESLPNIMGSPLAKVNFIKSRLVYESFCDFSKDIDLVSQEILLHDTRYIHLPANKRANVFSCILQPMKVEERKSLLQAEIHYRATKDVNRFTILLNNMRMMCVFDWWLSLLAFVSKDSPKPGPAPMEEVQERREVARPVDLLEEPLYPTTGVVTRRNPVVLTTGPVFELKLNITDSEVVVVADTAQWESSAVILRSTTVLAFRPACKEKPLSCNLNNAEVFSCVLGKEVDTALSIIDPVTINLEVWGRGEVVPTVRGLLDVEDDWREVERVADIQLQQLSVRLSYHDALMFRHILHSLPKQMQEALAGTKEAASSDSPTVEPANVRNQVEQLTALGFSRVDCKEALQQAANQLDEAALWLTQHARPERLEASPALEQTCFLPGSSVSFSTVQVKTSCINLVVIDDCRDSDCPLLELSLASLHLKQRQDGSGSLNSRLSASYYNRELSAWEPCMEPWACTVDWQNTRLASTASRNTINVKSTEIVNLNVTSTFLDLARMVKANWGEDYYSGVETGDGSELILTPRRRTPFVPFALKNQTGCALVFHCRVVAADGGKQMRQEEEAQARERSWIRVTDGETVPFTFESRTKARHQSSRQHQLHQIVVRVEGWREIKPVSVDRVGTFFRNVAAVRPSSSFTDLPPVRLVFSVTLEAGARKLITVRSALEVENKLTSPLRLRLENTFLRVADVKELELLAGQRLPLPLLYCWASITARPVVHNSHNWKYSDQPIHWCHILTSSDNSLTLHNSSHMLDSKAPPHRFLVAVRRLGFPQEALAIGPGGSKAWVQPAHRLTFLPPVTLTNLLPCALEYKVQDSKLRGSVRPGAETELLVDIFGIYVVDFCLDGFPGTGSLIMQPNSGAFEARIKLADSRSRPVYLNVKVSLQYGGAVGITAFAPYWIINKTGLPLLFRQEGDKVEAAGQYEEHEMARMVSPLLFSFPERDSSQSLVARVGQGLHPDGSPRWCKHFYVQAGSTVRRLRVQTPDKRPEWVYIVGINVRPGRGRYRLTTVVTLSPRFQLYNQSQHKIQFSQHCFATSFQDPGAEKTFLTAHPASSLAFHWPRLDMDQLLCMRLLDVPGSQWTGGFLIERVDSFQLTTRDRHGKARFLRVEISLTSSTFCIVISSADNFPPPFRIDNFSEVPIMFHQTGISDQALRSTVRPHQSVPYALDGPVLPPHLTVAAPGGGSATYNMNVTGTGSELTYENFIYIAFSGSTGPIVGGEDTTLVLDVPEGSRVVLGRKLGAQRSQLWRMTSTGMLQHEGSSPPQDPRHRSDESRTLVLDVAGPGDVPSAMVATVPLMLRKPDPQRSLTQHWRFTEDGRLCCQHPDLYVQATVLSPGHDVSLGPMPLVSVQRTSTGVPVEQALARQRLRPGSGFLGVRVTTDGPTRVLQVTDLKQPKEKSYARAEEPDWLETKKPWLVTAEVGGRKSSEAREERKGELQLVLQLKGGLGISLVNKEPGEELVYCCMTNIVIDYQSLPDAQLLDGSVQSIQVDNQTGDCSLHTILYVSPSSKTDDSRHLPSIHFAINRTPATTSNPNAEIFRHVILTIKNLTINIEEEMLYKVCQFAGLGGGEEQQEEVEEQGREQQLAVITASSQLTRYYFGILKLSLAQIKLSVQKSTKLSQHLVDIKRKLGLSLITFEDAAIELDPFSKAHPFETLPFLTSIIIKHYQDELLSQAVLILGSTDFLGNPLGFLNDVQEGVSGFVSDGNLGGLVKNVAHGAANSAAKMTGSLSYGLSRASLDQKYDDRRLLLKRKQSDNSGQHLVAGLKGLGFGMLGGLTSVITEPIQGAASSGVPGFLTGLGWGAVGVVTKPVIGILDMATETASAVRESSRSASRAAPARVRCPRVVQVIHILTFKRDEDCSLQGPGGTLPPYSDKEALGQVWLHRIIGARTEELYIGFEQLREGLMAVVSSERVVIFTVVEGREKLILTVPLSELELARTRTLVDGETGETSVVVEMVTRQEGPVAPSLVQRPQVSCDGEVLAASVAHTINWAKAQYEEARCRVGEEE